MIIAEIIILKVNIPLFKQTKAARALVGIVCFLVGIKIYDLIIFLKYPEIKREVEVYRNDERNIIIKGKAARMTLGLVAIIGIVVMYYFWFREENQTATIISSIAIIVIIFYYIAKYIYSKI